jgi:DNA-binding transcriptional regulator of glucitol operon
VVRRFLSPRWLVKHAAMVLLVAAFLVLGWWQVSRARAGNTLSIAYALEWPLFAAFVIGIWVREIRVELRAADPRPAAPVAPPPATAGRPVIVPVRRDEPAEEDDDPALIAYNEYLAWLAANPHRRPADYRREPLQE